MPEKTLNESRSSVDLPRARFVASAVTESAPMQHALQQNQDIVKLTNQLFNVLHQLEQHVAPADLTGKRLIHEAHERLQEISGAAQQT
jgi:hypothetical protein